MCMFFSPFPSSTEAPEDDWIVVEWGQWVNSLPHLADIYNTSSDCVLQEPVSNYNDIMCESPDHNYKAILWQFPGPYI